EAVVHDLVAHVDRRAEGLQRALDDLDRAIDAGTETTRVGEQDLHAVLAMGTPVAASVRYGSPIVVHRPGLAAQRGSRSPCAARCPPPKRLAAISSTAPTLIAESAMLNAGKCHGP